VIMHFKIYVCTRCRHEWPSKNENPTVCPKCKSPYWNKAKKETA